MTKECYKCKKEMTFNEFSKLSNFGLCYECSAKEDKKATWFWILTAVVVISVIMGVRILWAKIVYKDSRCAWAECRIQVDP